MANEWIRKDFAGGAQKTDITGGAISGSATSITVVDGSTYPDGSAGKFVIVIDRNTGSEEKVLITSRSGNTLTVSDRGYDGTAAVGHADGADVEHVMDAYSIEQALAHAAAASAVGSMSYRSAAFAYAEIVAGATGTVLKITGGVPGFSTIDIASLATAVANRLVPPGQIGATIGATEDPGWFFVNGQSVVNAQSLYPDMWARLPTSWKSGSSMVTPDWRGKMLVGDDAGATYTLGGSTGAMSKTITSANLPVHTHTIDHDHGSFTSGAEAAHTHGGSTSSAGNHNHGTTTGGTGSGPPEFFGGVRSADTGGDKPLGVTQSGGTALWLTYFNGTTTTGAHTHTITATAGSSHSHSVDVPNLTGASGNGGFANTALDITPAVGVVNWEIKAH